MSISQQAFMDQAIAAINAEVDNLIATFTIAVASNSREQTIADFLALFMSDNKRYTSDVVAAIAVMATMRLVDQNNLKV